MSLLLASLSSGCKLIDDILGKSKDGAAASAPPPAAPSTGGCNLTPAEHQTLVDLVLTPVSCSDTEPCPKGSFCDAEHNHTCNWQCLANSDCGAGTCSCTGTCSDTAPPPPPGDTVAASCPRDTAALDAVKSDPRACEWDDECPYGAHCDRTVGQCDWTCRDPDHACSSGETCDCLGNCITADADPQRPSQRLPSLSVSSPTVTVIGSPSDTDWQRAVVVKLTTGDESLLTGMQHGFDADVSVTAGSRLLVSCNATDASPDFGPNCTLDGGGHWKFQRDGSDWVAFQTLLLRPNDAATGDEEPDARIVRLYSARVADSPRLVGVEFDTDTTAVEFVPVNEFSYETEIPYTGVITLNAPADTNAADGQGPTVGTVELPIEAVASPHCESDDFFDSQQPCLLLHDPLHVLSAGTVVRLPLDGSLVGFNVLKAAGVSGNDYRHALGLGSLSRSTKTGSLTGTVALSVDQGRETEGTENIGSLRLRQSDVAECESDADCATGEKCFMQTFCGVSDERFPVPDNNPPLFHQPSKSWNDRLSDLLYQFVSSPDTIPQDTLGLKPRLYDPTFGLASTTHRGLFADAPLVEQSRIAQILATTQDPQAECQFSMHALIDQGRLPISSPSFGGAWTAAEIQTAINATCQNVTSSNGFRPSIACRGRFIQGSPSSADCVGIYANIKLVSPTTLPDAFTDHCTLRSFSLQRIQGNQGFAVGPFEIGLCPDWEPVAFPIESNGAELDLCYTRHAQSGFPGMASSTFDRSAPPLAFSGDLLCTGSNSTSSVAPIFPAGAELLFHRDLFSPPLDAQVLLQNCAQDLARTPPNGADDAVRDLFGASRCFSPAPFYSAFQNAAADAVLGKDERPQRLFLRLAQQWAEIHTFIANETRQELTMPRIDLQLGDTTPLAPIDASTLIDDLNQAAVLELVQPWASIPDGLLRNPIYRPLALPEKPEWEQRFGPAPALLELATAQMNSLESFANEASLANYQDRTTGAVPAEVRAALEKFGNGLRFALAIERLSTDLYHRANGSHVACGSDDDCPDVDFDASFNSPKCVDGACRPSVWAERWLHARDALDAARGRALLAGRRLATGENPLGISENDLPLFFGDLTGTNSRFFASSDYLMSTWAVSAVATARESLDQARSAWISQRNSKVQDTLLAADRDRRLETIRSNAGAVVASSCGLDSGTTADQALDRVTQGKLTIDQCYFVPPTQNPDCALDANPLPTDITDHSADIQQCVDNKIHVLEDRNLAATTFFKDPCHAWFRDNALTDATVNVWAKTGPSNWVVDTCFIFACGMHWIKPHLEKKLGFFQGDGPVADAIEAKQATLGLHSCAENGFGHFWDPDEKEFLDCDTPVPGFICNSHDNLCFQGVEGFNFDDSGAGGGPLHPAVKATQFCGAGKYKADRQLALQAYTVSAQDRFNAQDECEQGETLGVVTQKVARSGRPLGCYRGGLGSAALRVLKAQQEADMAQILWGEKQLEYSIQGRACAQLQEDTTRLNDRTTAFNAEMDSLRSARDSIDSFTRMINFEASLVSAVASEGASSGSAVNGFGSAVFGEMRSDIETQMAHLTEEHQAFLQRFAQDQAIKACFIEADKIRATFTSSKERIVIQATEAADALNDFQNLMTETKRAVSNGSSQLSREQNRAYGGYAFHYWYDEKLSRYEREFAWAKRLVFLVMRAVEYEFQQSVPIRSEILTATSPDQLEAALQSLQQEVATRAINRRRPEEASAVVSLRDDVLGLKDRSDAPAGERAYSSSLTFRSRIWDARYAVRDSTGNYLGQGIPFTLAPQGTLANRCAERLWRVTATLQGDGLSQSQPGAPVVLLKANTFTSQWCDGHEQPDHPVQLATIQPSHNLFKDGANAVDPEDNSLFSTAALYPWFNVRRADFFKLDYQEGASEELAGRGLYGDYILLFPRELLEGNASLVAPPDGDVGVSVHDEVFPLDHVEDVLLRFDYLSVDNYPDVGN